MVKGVRAGYGSSKGAAYERTLAVTFSMWISDGASEDILWRTAMSGGRATLGRKKGRNFNSQAGDLGPTDSRGEWMCDTFLIEAKRYRKFDWQRDIMDIQSACARKATSRPAEIFLHTIDEAARSAKKAPLVILRADRQKDLIMTNAWGLNLLSVNGEYDLAVTATFPEIDAFVFKLESLIPAVPYHKVRGVHI